MKEADPEGPENFGPEPFLDPPVSGVDAGVDGCGIGVTSGM